MSLVTRLQPLFDELPSGQRAERDALWKQLLAQGFPDRRQERWRYTDLAAALPDSLQAPAPAAKLELPAIDGLRRIAFVNGNADEVAEHERNEGSAATTEDSSDLVNAALATTGLLLDVQSGVAAPAVHLCTRTNAGSVHLRHRMVLAAGANAFVYWDDCVTDAAGFVTQTLDIELGNAAQLTLVRAHHNGAQGPTLLRTQARLAEASQLRLVGFDSGSGLTRHNLNASLDGIGARVELNGVFAPYAKGQIDTFATVDHCQPETVSRMRFRGLGMDRGIGVLTGRVHVHRGAQRTDSDQQLSSLLLSSRAQINAKPELEIYADDVTCAHGNAIGQIDEDALHYLQTRGIPRAQARALLIGGFAAETLQVTEHEAVGDALLQALDQALAHADWSTE